MSVLDNYNLIFTNSIHTYFDGQKDNVKLAIHNVPNDYLGYFLNEMRGDIDDVLTDINLILSWGFYDEEYGLHFGLDKLYMEYTANSIKFYDKFQGNLFQEIPFNDLIEILQLWKTFNQTPPLHNQVL